MKTLEFLPVRDIVFFPGTIAPIYVGRPSSLKTLNIAMNKDKKMVLSLQKDPMNENPQDIKELHTVGVTVNILQVVKNNGKTMKVLVEVEDRVSISSVMFSSNGCMAQYKVIEETVTNEKELEALFRNTLSKFENYLRISSKFSTELVVTLRKTIDFPKAIDIIASHLEIDSSQKQELLETTDVIDRGYKVLDILNSEIEILNLEKSIDDKVKSKISEDQKNYYIKEKISTLRKELGDSPQENEYEDIEDKLKNKNLPENVKSKIESELKKLYKMPPFSSEATLIRNYIDTLLDLPWTESTKDILDIKLASSILDRDHYGLKDAKIKVLDYLAVKKLNPSMNGNILCFSGPPGIGKTSIVKSIAEAMGRKFVRVALGGVRDEAEIRGHRRTYIGSMPGKIIKAMKEAGTNNPVILIDEIDKMSNDYKGDPESAMLEVLDPEQNKFFEDHYIDLQFDLSKVFFVATANDLRNVSSPLRDRMEIVNLSSYTEFDKLNIATKYLVDQAKKENGLNNINISIPDKVMLKIINEYTREAGVRNLKREIINLFRKLAREVVENDKTKFNIKISDVEKYLGKPKYRPEKSKKAISKIGVVNGLAWTAVGGVTLDVQGVSIPGNGDISLTGTLGNVMKESAQVAFTYVKSNLNKFKPVNKNFFKENNIHLHFPEGATPKDGPSAGITITTAIISVIANRKVRQDIAMTGEITITGEVLAIGGVREKVIGAHRAGINEVILPYDNKVDIDEIPDELKDIVKIHFVKTYDEVAKLVFVK